MTQSPSSIGVVIIGRNEGERLRLCLESVLKQSPAVVYVDSGSTDGSISLALSLGVVTIELDLAIPFTAARARNTGFNALIDAWPNICFVQFVDGDCVLLGGWLECAHSFLTKRPEVAAVAGRIKERRPNVSIYNKLGEMEWNFLGIGDVGSVGGIFLIRRDAFEDVKGFDVSVSSGEEPEMCQRLSFLGWLICRVEEDMALHDLSMTRFGQWWKRQVRNGYGGLDVSGRFGLHRFSRNVLRVRFWSSWPFLVVAFFYLGHSFSSSSLGLVMALALFSLWPLQMARICLRTLKQGHPFRVAIAYAFFTMISFWPQMLGHLQLVVDRFKGRGIRLIEYKSPPKFSQRENLGDND